MRDVGCDTLLDQLPPSGGHAEPAPSAFETTAYKQTL